MSAFRFFAVAALTFAFAAPALAKSASRTRLLASPNPSTAGQTVTLVAEVDGLGGGAPTGTVKFVDGSAVLGSATLTFKGAGQATLAAGYQSCALTSAGGVKCWGYNFYGQLGDGTRFISRYSPVAVSGLSSGVVAIAAARLHTCALTSAGAIKCWGDNDDGGLGDGSRTTRLTPVAVTGLSSGVVAITAGQGYSCALTSAGAVKCWGNNGGGQLGDGTRWDRLTPVAVSGLSSGVVAISASGGHTCALTSAGAVKCWGGNQYGELGDGTTTYRETPVAVSGLSSGVAAISAGPSHTCALTVAGAVKCWGWNHYGQLGDGTTTDRLIPVAVSGLSSGVAAIAAGGAHTCATTSAGAAKCWGGNYRGSLGDGTNTDRHTPTLIPGFTTLVRARASLSTRALGVGAHSLRAGFGGDASHTGAIGGVVQIVR
jgi:alpha-tubulin suppressor-like RCC1 family protein